MGRVGSLSALKFLINGEDMKHLKELHEKLEEYNRSENEHWMILIDGTRLNYVFIVHSEDINTFPSWWPIADTAETIEDAFELVPKEETYELKAYSDQGGQLTFPRRISLEELKKVIETLEQ
jgi:hypothetical protein